MITKHVKTELHCVALDDAAIVDALQKNGVALPHNVTRLKDFKINRTGGQTYITWETDSETVPALAMMTPQQDEGRDRELNGRAMMP